MNLNRYLPWNRARSERAALHAEVERLRKQVTSHVCLPAPQVHWFPSSGAANPAPATVTFWPGGERSPQTFAPPFTTVCAAAAPPLIQFYNVTGAAR